MYCRGEAGIAADMGLGSCLQVEKRQREEKLKLKEAEVEMLHKQVASLRDYVVTNGAPL